MTINKDFNPQRWVDNWQRWERSCADNIANDKQIWGIDAQMKFFRDLQTMLKEMTPVPDTV